MGSSSFDRTDSRRRSHVSAQARAWQPTARRVEISDGMGFKESFPSLGRAARECGISSHTVLKYALDHGKTRIVRRSDKKVFHVREVGRAEV